MCQRVPDMKEWALDLDRANNHTSELETFRIVKRLWPYQNMEPIFIGTNSDPPYDERLSWDGRGEKMTQGGLHVYDVHAEGG